MKKIRRVVTGHNKDGQSTIVSDEQIESVSIGTGKHFIQLWGKDSVPVHPDEGMMPGGMEWFPLAGGHRFFVWVVPPQTQRNDDPKSKDEMEALLPGFLQYFEADNPGMHTTNTVDCTYLISGSITLELDNEEKVTLESGDSVVQNGTRHKWYNEGTIPAVLITTCVGAERIP